MQDRQPYMLHLGGSNYAEMRPDLYEVDYFGKDLNMDDQPTCAICGRPTIQHDLARRAIGECEVVDEDLDGRYVRWLRQEGHNLIADRYELLLTAIARLEEVATTREP